MIRRIGWGWFLAHCTVAVLMWALMISGVMYWVERIL